MINMKKITKKETLAAIQDSIKHWERMRDGKNGASENPGPAACALCVLFFDSSSCAGCPIATKTVQKLCLGTPYYDAEKTWELRFEQPNAWRYASQEMIDFLKSLLPERK